MNSDIKVSVIIPVYNAEKYLEQCLNSVAGQTLKEIQMICVDDGSTDESVSIIKAFMERDDRIVLLHHEHTGYGAAGARNCGMEYIKGEYSIFLDADDFFDEHLLEKDYNFAKRTHADIVLHNGNYFDDSAKCFISGKTTLNDYLLPKKEVFTLSEVPEYAFELINGAAWNFLIRSSFLSEKKLKFQNIYHADDMFFSNTALCLADKIGCVNERMVNYRFNNPSGQTENKEVSPLSAPLAYMELKKWLQEQGLLQRYWKAYVNRACWYLKFYLDTLKSYESFETLFNYLKKEGLEELGLLSAKREEFRNADLFDWLKKIETQDVDHFLFSKLHRTSRLDGFGWSTGYVLPIRDTGKKERIILYGAGTVGKSYFVQNILNEKYEILAWVDKRHGLMSSLVLPVEDIKNFQYDFILIAIEGESVIKEVKKSLTGMGIPAEKILSRFDM